MSLCVVEGLSFSYGKRKIIEDVSFALDQGEFIAFVGPSGCGKSTLLKCLAGLLTSESGKIDIRGGDSGGNQRCAFMFQRSTLLPWLTVRQNVLLPLYLQSIPVDEADISGTLHEVNIAHLANVSTAELSGGEAQRVAFARAILEQRPILLLDEPFSNLDELSRRSLATLLSKTIHEHRFGGVLVTHTLHDAVFLCDVVYVLSSSPARIVGKVNVSLKQPRSNDLWMGEELLPEIHQARNLLESKKAYES